MSTYVIGDVQGCFKPLKQLLTRVGFQPNQDNLWLVGDIVNRGPDSLAVLRFLRNLPKTPVIVLGNHDLHLLAVHSGQVQLRAKDTIQAVLEAPDGDELCDWLRHFPLTHYDEAQKYLLVHAGLPPQWQIEEACQYAHEVELVLRSEKAKDFFAHMYGSEPTVWSDQLTGYDRLRFIVNALTRIRFCTAEGELDFSFTGKVGSQDRRFQPWFTIASRASKDKKIIFGHWAALQGYLGANLFGIDSGCVWGNCLTALRLEDQKLFHVKCDQFKDIMVE